MHLHSYGRRGCAPGARRGHDNFAAMARLLGVAHVFLFGGNPQLDPPVSFNIPLVDQI